MSGVIPQVAALMGPCAAGTAYIPGLADFVPMVTGRGSMALAGPHLVRAAIGEDVTQEELGGSRVHCRKSGVGDLEVADDEECIARIRSTSPSSRRTARSRRRVRPVRDPVDRSDEELLDVLPESNRKPYDMYDVIRRIVDDGDYLDLKGAWARTIITCLARMGGRPVGIVANQPRQLGGILDNDSADKAARFVKLCDAFGIPLVFLQDVPGLHGRHEGRGGGHHPARREDAPRGRRGDGAEGHRRAAQGLRRRLLRDVRPRVRAGPDRRLADAPRSRSWAPRARSRSSSASRSRRPSRPRSARKAELIAAYREVIDVYVAARNGMIDDVIDPRETRPTIIRALELRRGQARRAAVEAARRRAGVTRGLRRARPGSSSCRRRGRARAARAGASSNVATRVVTRSGASRPSAISASTSGITARACERPMWRVALRPYISAVGIRDARVQAADARAGPVRRGGREPCGASAARRRRRSPAARGAPAHLPRGDRV